MRKLKVLIGVLSFLFLFSSPRSQTNFSLESYKSFLNAHQDMNAEDLLSLYSAGNFKKEIPVPTDVDYFDSVSIKYSLTDYEKSLINKHGFVVTERVTSPSFMAMLTDIFHKDLPLFISSDALLHALHASYDDILKEVELNSLIPRLKDLLYKLKAGESNLRDKYGSSELMLNSLKDVDLYISVALKLLGENVQPYYSENQQMFVKILSSIAAKSVEKLALFGDVKREIDFSQFTVRGHYTDPNHPILGNYFQTMMWLGRIEFYLIPPKGTFTEIPFKDVQRQIIDSYLLVKLFSDEEVKNVYKKIEKAIETFVGEQDNTTVENLREVFDSLKVTSVFYFSDSSNVAQFQEYLAKQTFAGQKILSHILFANPCNPDSIQPATAFLPFGQRFVIDSYITGNVVFDKIEYQSMRVFRALPSTLDILFALGNSAAAQLLVDELNKYHYASNLAALRFLVDSYDSDFWNKTFYNGWLNAIRALNPKEERSNLPAFMQTAAWNQEKITSQLASWTELRHDNLLYAKQSYTGGIICSFPYVYVEPIPEFYEAIFNFAQNAKEQFETIGFDNFEIQPITGYFEELANTAWKLKTVAEKELNRQELTAEEEQFLKDAIKKNSGGMCGAALFNGWYPSLYFNYSSQETRFFDKDFVAADYHTAPTDETGMMVGWVAHAGTGPINLGVFVAQLPSGKSVAFAGPVASYYEYVTTNFKRITDEEWDSVYVQSATRPDFVNSYLADAKGEKRGEGRTLFTGVKEDESKNSPSDYLLASNYPNPFGSGSASHSEFTTIAFTLPQKFTGEKVSVKIYDLMGKEVAVLLNKNLSAGNYLTRWNGKNKFGETVASGVYFYRITCWGKSTAKYLTAEGKISFIK